MDRTSVFRTPVTGVGGSITTSGTAANSSDQKPGPTSVMVWGTEAFYVTVGEGVTAVTTSVPIPAGVPFFLPIPPGTGAPWRVSALQITTAGTVYYKAFD